MSSFTNINDGSDYWSEDNNKMYTNSFYNPEAEYSNLQSQQLDFQSFGDASVDQNVYYTNANMYQPKSTFLDPITDPKIFTPSGIEEPATTDFDEPPLLEELEIYPDRILEKTLAVLNPFHRKGLADDAEFLTQDTDLAGPLSFCLMLAVCLFISGSSTPFGYIYGISMISCIMMYVLLALMTINSGVFTLTSVASILGYCLLPTVALSLMRLFISLHGNIGLILTLLVVLWSSLSASRLFVTISGDDQQRPLIAYPCALVYGVFALLVIF
ncbi:Yip1 domain-containing 1 [Carabus blaptoides fortunei]